MTQCRICADQLDAASILRPLSTTKGRRDAPADEFNQYGKEGHACLYGRVTGDRILAPISNSRRPESDPPDPRTDSDREVLMVGRGQNWQIPTKRKTRPPYDSLAGGGDTRLNQERFGWGAAMSPVQAVGNTASGDCIKRSAAFCSLYKIVQDSSNGVAYLGASKDGKRARFASILPGTKSRPIVVLQETAIVQRDAAGKGVALGDVTREFYIDEEGYVYPADASIELEALALTEDELNVIAETALWGLTRCRFRPEPAGAV